MKHWCQYWGGGRQPLQCLSCPPVLNIPNEVHFKKELPTIILFKYAKILKTLFIVITSMVLKWNQQPSTKVVVCRLYEF